MASMGAVEWMLDLADRAADRGPAPIAVSAVGLKSTLDTHFDAAALYVVDGDGLWRASKTGGGVELRELFGGRTVSVSAQEWGTRCATGRIREVR